MWSFTCALSLQPRNWFRHTSYTGSKHKNKNITKAIFFSLSMSSSDIRWMDLLIRHGPCRRDDYNYSFFGAVFLWPLWGKHTSAHGRNNLIHHFFRPHHLMDFECIRQLVRSSGRASVLNIASNAELCIGVEINMNEIR